MSDNDKSRDEILNELFALRLENNRLKELIEKSFEYDPNPKSELQKAVSRIQSYLDDLVEGFMVIGFDWSYIYVNASAARTAYVKPEELYGKKITEVFPGVVNTEIFKAFSKCMNERITIKLESSYTFKNGITSWFELHIEPVSEGILVLTLDITERKSLEDKLDKSRNELESFFNVSPDLFTIVSKEGLFSRLNPTWENLLGFKLEELIGREFIDFIHPDDIESTLKEFSEELDGKNVYNFINRYKSKDGSYKWLEWHGRAAPDKNSAFAIARDISESKLTKELLWERERILQAISTAARDSIIMIDQDGHITYWNEAAIKMFGYSEQEVIGKNLHNLLAPQHYLNDYHHGFEIFRSSGEGNALNKSIEVYAIHKNGHEFPIELSLSALNVRGNWHAIGIIHDISERKIAENALKESESRLRELNSTKDTFFSIIAHDLKSPMSSFIGLTKVLAEGIFEMNLKEIQKLLLILNDLAVNLYDMLENLLEWSRMQRGLIIFNPTEIILSGKINNILLLVSGSASAKEIEINIDVPPELKVIADERMLESTLRNFLSNAIKFTKKGGMITLSAHQTIDKSVLFSIKDTGIGMEQEMIDKLFRLGEDVGRRGTENEQTNGLGLFLCKEFIEKHGGKIWVESEEGNGSTFFFVIPDKSSD